MPATNNWSGKRSKGKKAKSGAKLVPICTVCSGQGMVLNKLGRAVKCSNCEGMGRFYRSSDFHRGRKR